MKTKKMIINFLADTIPLIIVSVLGIFKMKLFLQVLGDETLGLYQLCQQIMVYVAIIDGGLNYAVTYSLYKPNIDDNRAKLNAILSSAKRVFSIIGAAIFAIAFLASFLAPYLIKESSFSNGYVSLCFILFSLSSVVEYFFVPYQTLLEVKERKYLSSLAIQTGQIIQSIIEIIMLLNGVSFISILIMHSIVKLLANLAMMIICKKCYPELKFNNKEKDYSYLPQVKYLIFNKINGLIGSNIDVLIISKLLGLKAVAIYSAYNYIVNMLKTILGKISTSVNAIVGNILAKDKKSSYTIFEELNSMLFYVATVICVSLTLAINGFIEIWYEKEIATSFAIALPFVGILFFFIVKIATNVIINGEGLFKETRFCTLADTIVNLILSLALVNFFGISGVLIASCISAFIAEYCLKSYVVYKKVFEINPLKYHIKNTKFIIICILDLLMGYYIVSSIAITNIISWFAFFIIFTIINAIFIFIIYSKLKETKFIDRFLHFIPSKIIKLVKKFSKIIQIVTFIIILISLGICLIK